MNFIFAYKDLPADLKTNGASLIDWLDTPEVNRVLNGQYRFYGNYKRDGQFSSYLKKGNFIKAMVDDGSYQYFEIFNAKRNLSSISVTARHIGFMATKNFIDYSFTSSGNGTRIISDLQNNLAFAQPFMYTSNIPTTHQFTAKQVSPIEALIGSNGGNENLVGVTSGELDMDNYDIKLVKQIGQDNGFRIDFGVNLEAIEEEIDEESIVNSLYLIGGVPDNDYDEDKEPITFKYLEVEGVTDNTRRIGKYENSDCKTVADLKKWGQTKFDNDRVHEPTITHTISMVHLEHTLEYIDLWGKISQLRFGDVAHVHVSLLDIDVAERMVEYTYYPTLGKYKEIVLGNDFSLYTSQVSSESAELKKKIDNRTETLVTNILNATAWITGNSGGHVVFRPEKAPEEILIMDTKEVATAKRVWRWNLNGLGYSDNGVNGPFGIAMTSKGEIVADFIKVGIINAEVFETSFSAVGDQLKMVAGALEAWNNSKKIMTLNKKGMEFWNTQGQSIGTIGTTDSNGNPFPDAQTAEPLEDTSLVIKTNNNNNILISPTKGKGFVMLGNGTTLHLGDLNIYGTLRVNGVEISGSGGASSGGGGWSGDYPSVVLTQAQKFAWQAWVTLRLLGYSESAAAGILGDINGEVGDSMNPDTEQINGPAYGAVQFDGSAYPLIGSPTSNGREYFQRLHNASGVGGDYRDMVTQMKVVNWTMKNGQWIGVINPKTVEGYKAMTDARTAATVFERNFERPASTHPIRSDYAQKWYDLFSGVEITKKDWINPLHDAAYNVTQEWDQIGYGTGTIHGGIDLAPTGGRSPNIYAARSGTVSQVVYNHAIGGNYIVIKHSDNYWTYYGHLATINVKTGDNVTTDTVLGICGMTGLATGIHLHFEVWQGSEWNRINPRSVIDF